MWQNGWVDAACCVTGQENGGSKWVKFCMRVKKAESWVVQVRSSLVIICLRNLESVHGSIRLFIVEINSGNKLCFTNSGGRQLCLTNSASTIGRIASINTFKIASFAWSRVHSNISLNSLLALETNTPSIIFRRVKFIRYVAAALLWPRFSPPRQATEIRAKRKLELLTDTLSKASVQQLCFLS